MNWMTSLAVLLTFSKVMAWGMGVCMLYFNVACARKGIYVKYLFWMMVCVAWVVATWGLRLAP